MGVTPLVLPHHYRIKIHSRAISIDAHMRSWARQFVLQLPLPWIHYLCHTEPTLEAVVSNKEIILPHSAISLDDYSAHCPPTYGTIYLPLVHVGVQIEGHIDIHGRTERRPCIDLIAKGRKTEDH